MHGSETTQPPTKSADVLLMSLKESGIPICGDPQLQSESMMVELDQQPSTTDLEVFDSPVLRQQTTERPPTRVLRTAITAILRPVVSQQVIAKTVALLWTSDAASHLFIYSVVTTVVLPRILLRSESTTAIARRQQLEVLVNSRLVRQRVSTLWRWIP